MYSDTQRWLGYYRIAQNFGGGKLWRIWRNERHSPIRFTIVTNGCYCKFANVFFDQNSETIDSPKVLPHQHFALYGISSGEAEQGGRRGNCPPKVWSACTVSPQGLLVHINLSLHLQLLKFASSMEGHRNHP